MQDISMQMMNSKREGMHIDYYREESQPLSPTYGPVQGLRTPWGSVAYYADEISLLAYNDQQR